jgi:hypothetical protein
MPRSANRTIDLSVEDQDVEVLENIHRPSRLRSFFVKTFVFVVFTALLLLVATELSIVLGIPWLDPRPHLVRGYHALLGLLR